MHCMYILYVVHNMTNQNTQMILFFLFHTFKIAEGKDVHIYFYSQEIVTLNIVNRFQCLDHIFFRVDCQKFMNILLYACMRHCCFPHIMVQSSLPLITFLFQGLK